MVSSGNLPNVTVSIPVLSCSLLLDVRGAELSSGAVVEITSSCGRVMVSSGNLPNITVSIAVLSCSLLSDVRGDELSFSTSHVVEEKAVV